jgi:hypothetical protein
MRVLLPVPFATPSLLPTEPGVGSGLRPKPGVDLQHPWPTVETQREKIPGPKTALLELRLHGRGPTSAEIELYFERWGVGDPRARARIAAQLSTVDGALAARLLKRLSMLRRPEAETIVSGLVIDLGRGEGPFLDDPARLVREVLKRRSGTVKAEWRNLGTRPVAELSAVLAQVEWAVGQMLGQGFGYLRGTDPEEQVRRAPAFVAAFSSVFDRLDPELRGELLAKLPDWPPYQLKWMVQDVASLGLGKGDQPRAPTDPELRSLEDRWRVELRRDPQLLQFLEVSGYEDGGNRYRERDFQKPELIAAAAAILNKRTGRGPDGFESHQNQALEILCRSSSADPLIDRALRQHAKSGGRDRWRASLGLLARGVPEVPLESLLVAAKDRWQQRRVLAELRELRQEGRLGAVDGRARDGILKGFGMHPESLHTLVIAWLEAGQADVPGLVQELGLRGPKLDAAIAAARPRG